MRRLLLLSDYALASLRRRWQRQLSVVIIYALVVAFFASIVFFTASLKQEARLATEMLPELWVQRIAGGRLVPIENSFVQELQGIAGVKQVHARVWGYVFDSPTGAVFTVMGASGRFDGLPITLLQDSIGTDQAICGTGLLEARGLELGERLTIQDSEGNLRAFRISGVFQTETDLLSRDLLVLHPQSARQILGLDTAHCTDIALSISNPLEVATIGRKIDRTFGGIRVVAKQELQATYSALFGWRGGLFLYGAMVSGLAFLLFAWERASGLNSEERKELAILKGIGWGIGDVLAMKLFEALAIAATATLLGLLAGYWHVYVAEAPFLRPFLIGWSTLYPSYQLVPAVSLEDLLLVVCLAIVPYLSAVLIPAWRGAIADPSTAMRGN